ncbi:MAG TPA: flagellar basal body L-ring protein FlgH [Bryobacteraceae bacterium]|jgi:flagellar L-ring protein precursor FlgH|nr:flagellar basal body L-ring protein FlgH [Bryobacteraceae bacterium]
MKIGAIVIVILFAGLAAAEKPKKQPEKSALDQTLEQIAATQGTEHQTIQPGSVWTPTALFSDLSSDLRARRVGDIVTILVREKASAVSSGTVKTQRNSSLQASISAAGGITRPTGPLVNLAKAGTSSALDGQGATTRDTTLTASISTVVTQVLPNGSLVIQGTKNVKINTENQVLGLRGIVRPVDLSAGNIVSSDRVAQMDLQVNGKGVVGDSVKRPFILYRLLMDILP